MPGVDEGRFDLPAPIAGVVVLALTLAAEGEITVRGRVVAVRMPERMRSAS